MFCHKDVKSIPEANLAAYRRHSRAMSRLVSAILTLNAALPAQTTFSESFTGTSAPGWVFGSNTGDNKPFFTAATGSGGYNGAGDAIGAAIDPSGNGWLRMNSNTGNQSTYALLDTEIFSVNARMEIEMEYAFWNGTGADGITFFLVDGSRDSSTFTPGAYGGSMGYAQRSGEVGMPSGYLGFALDNYGNYSNGNEGRVGGITNDGTLYPNRISVRGPESSNYTYIASNSTPLPGQMDFPSTTSRPDQTGADYRALKIIFDANNQLTVQMKFGAGSAFTTAFTTDLSAYERPDTFKIGFTGATGGSTELHEIRNLTLTSTPWSTGSGAYEWDNGAGTTTWGTLAGGEANSNWYSTEAAADNKTPLRDSDVLFGNRPTNNGTNNTQQVALGNNVEVRNMTFDTGINYSIGTVGDGRLITFGDTALTGLPSINVNDYNGVYGRHKINSDLSIVENIAVRNYSYSTLCINGAIGLGAHTLTTSGYGATNLNGVITGSGPIVINGATFDPSIGAGIVTIAGDNAATYTGTITVNNGQLVVLANNALGNTGSTTSVNDGGTLSFRGGVTSPENVTIAGVGTTLGRGEYAGALYNDGGDNTLSGNITLSENTAVGSRSGNLTLSGAISDGASDFSLTKLNDGVVTLSGTNTYSGATILSGGALRLITGAALSANSNLQLSGGVLEIAGDLNGGTSGDFSHNRGTGAGAIQWIGDGGFSASGANRTVRLNNGTSNVTWASSTNFVGDGYALLLGSDYADATLTFANALSLNDAQREIRVSNGSAAVDGNLSGRIRGGNNGTGTGGLIKTGAGTLELSYSGAGANDYSGDTEIRDGALRVTTVDSLSTNSNFQLNGGVLEIGTDLNGGTGGDYSPNLGTAAGNLQWTGSGGFSAASATRTITLNGGAALIWGTTSNFVSSSSSLIFGATGSDNTVTLSNALSLGASGTRTIQTVQGTNSAVSSATLSGVVSGNASLAVEGNGHLDLTGNNTLTGDVTIEGAELRLLGASGDLAQASGFSVRLGGTITLDNTSGFADRIGAVGVTLAGSTLNFLGQTGNIDTSETIGVLTLAGSSATGGTTGSANTINIARGDATGSATLTAAALTRNNGTTANFTNPAGTLGTIGDNPRLVFTSAPTLDDGILAYATINGTDFATYTTVNSVTPDGLSAYTGYLTGAQTGWTITSDNAAPAADQTLTGVRTINSLKLASGIDVAQAGFALTLQSGGILSTGGIATTISGGILTTGTATDIVIHTYNTADTVVSSILTGSNGLVKSGSGTLTLSGASANTYTGITRVNEGTLVLGKSAGGVAIAGDGSPSSTDLFVGDGRGIDTLRLDANEQIANDVNVVLQGGAVGNDANKAVLDLNGTSVINGAARAESFHSLRIEGNSVVDFTGGTVCAPTFLYLDTLDVASNALLTVGNWIEFTDFLLVNKLSFDSTEMPRIVFDGYGGSANWKVYDSSFYQITPYAPVPEPSTYGALAVGGLTAFAAYRRRQKRHAA